MFIFLILSPKLIRMYSEFDTVLCAIYKYLVL